MTVLQRDRVTALTQTPCHTVTTQKKKKRPATLQGVSSIKHYYKIQNLEGILETFSLIYQPTKSLSPSLSRLQRYNFF